MDNLKDLNITQEKLPVLPLRDVVIFPYMVFPVLVGRSQSIKAAMVSLETDKLILLVAQKNPAKDDPDMNDLYDSGTVGRIVQTIKMPNDVLKILVDGIGNAKISQFEDKGTYIEAKFSMIEDKLESFAEEKALIKQLSTTFNEFVQLNKKLPKDIYTVFESLNDPIRRMYYVAANIEQSVEKKQTILSKTSLIEKFYSVIELLKAEIDQMKIESEIDKKIHEKIHKSQRKFFIQEQIRILQDELGDEEPNDPEIEKLAQQIKNAKMPTFIQKKAEEELNKLKRTPQMSPETTVIRNYIDWLTNIPWVKKTKDNLNIDHVKTVLDEDHFGLEKPKERILEHIAVLNLVGEMKSQILCFTGPPGVGKTSLAKSIARALGRKLIRISLGGIRDEAEIRGHRRTYIGSMPGKIIQSMKKAGTINPVLVLDEIDKMSSDFRGDPSSAMLEVLDPEQNYAFNDHYLDCDYDLSKVMFITTANVKYNIPLPLQDRMEIIELPGYLEYDKIEIASRHIIPKQLKAHGLDQFNVVFNPDAISKLINEYTREAGVRNLEREITNILRKIAKEIVSSNKKKSKNTDIFITVNMVEKYLGVPKFRNKTVTDRNRIGSAVGLAWTSVGGDILNVDVSIMEGIEKLTLTGQLGEVMKESAHAAFSYIRSHAKALGIKPDFYRKKEIHIHLPEGAIPKDGPSAGITLIMALISAIKKTPTKKFVAMTGEITLKGEVLGIGGLNEKLLAAQRSGIKTVLIPQENVKNLSEINERVKKGLKIIPVEYVEDALKHVFFENK